MSEIIFPEGISVFKPNERAPEFVKGNITIDAKKLQEWLQTHPEYRDEQGRVRLVIKESSKQGNNWYLSVDTWKPKSEPTENSNKMPDFPEEDINPENIPF